MTKVTRMIVYIDFHEPQDLDSPVNHPSQSAADSVYNALDKLMDLGAIKDYSSSKFEEEEDNS